MYIKEILLGILILYVLSTVINIKIPNLSIIGYLIRDWFIKFFRNLNQIFLY